MDKPITLTEGQQAAYKGFIQCILDSEQTVFVLEGFAGTGKSTLVTKMLADLPATVKTAKLITNSKNPWDYVLTATTNKACEALREIVGMQVQTIQSFLKFYVRTDYDNNEKILEPRQDAEIVRNKIIFIDEASFIDRKLLQLIFEWTEDCKIIFIGDPAQLAPVKASGTPVFDAGFPTKRLTEVRRQADDSQIQELSTAFRETVCGAPFPLGIVPDGESIIYASRPEFNSIMLKEFTREDWHYTDSKFLAWTNRRVNEYNQFIRDRVHGDPIIQVGDYVTCNSHISTKSCRLRTDEMVQVTGMRPDSQFDCEGWRMELNHRLYAFMPASMEIRKKALAIAKAQESTKMLRRIEEEWIDLRAVYAQTVNKSQGSTYNMAFLDLDDIGSCYNPNQVARMMYVAVSRARYTVYLTGELTRQYAAA